MGTAASVGLRGRSLIGFASGSNCGNEFRAVNPADRSELAPTYYSATPDELDSAARLAGDAFPVYSRVPASRRAAFLRTVADRIEALEEPVTARMVQESGLPIGRAKSELTRTSGQLRLFADVIEEGSWVNARIDPALPDRKPPRPDIRSMLRPLGPVAVFCASNFPLAFSVAGGDTASALAAGNPVVVKAHPAHPGTAELIGGALRDSVREHGLPDGVFSLLFDGGIEIGTALVQHPAVKAVGFTGSRSGGLALIKAATSRAKPIPFYAEMSSTNPVFVLPGAMKERGQQIAAGLHGSMTLGAGQFCTKPGIVLLNDDAAADAFTNRLSELVAASHEFTLLTSGIQSAYQRGSAERSRSGHARKIAEGNIGSKAGFHVPVLAYEAEAHAILTDQSLSEELFGPSTLVVKYTTRDEMLQIARNLEGHLTATVHGTEQDLAKNSDLVEILERKVGRLVFNGFPTGVEVSHAMVHGGPFPATSDGRSTSVGSMAILRFARPVCFQGFPNDALPAELQNSNPLEIWRMVDGRLTRKPIRPKQVAATD